MIMSDPFINMVHSMITYTQQAYPPEVKIKDTSGPDSSIGLHAQLKKIKIYFRKVYCPYSKNQTPCTPLLFIQPIVLLCDVTPTFP